MKYKVLHSFLQSPDKTFTRDQNVTPDELTKAGFDVDHLLANTAIEPLEGSEVVVVSKLPKGKGEDAAK